MLHTRKTIPTEKMVFKYSQIISSIIVADKDYFSNFTNHQTLSNAILYNSGQENRQDRMFAFLPNQYISIKFKTNFKKIIKDLLSSFPPKNHAFESARKPKRTRITKEFIFVSDAAFNS